MPMARGFVYLVAIVDWFTRQVLAWRVSISVDAEFCVEALEEALARYAYASVPEARAGIGRYLAFYNAVRPHSALGGRTPDQLYFAQPLLAAA